MCRAFRMHRCRRQTGIRHVSSVMSVFQTVRFTWRLCPDGKVWEDSIDSLWSSAASETDDTVWFGSIPCLFFF